MRQDIYIRQMLVPLAKAGCWQGAEICHWCRNTESVLPSASSEPPLHPWVKTPRWILLVMTHYCSENSFGWCRCFTSSSTLTLVHKWFIVFGTGHWTSPRSHTCIRRCRASSSHTYPSSMMRTLTTVATSLSCGSSLALGWCACLFFFFIKSG